MYCLQDNKNKINYKKFKKLLEIVSLYDVIVVHHGDPYLKFYFYLLTKKVNKKFVTVVHSCYEDRYFYPNNTVKRILAKLIYQKSMLNSNKIIFVSKAGKLSYEKKFKIPSNLSCVVYNGVGIDKIEAGKSTILCIPNVYEITYIGRLEEIKGVDLLINAIAKINNKYSVHCSIIGDGSIREDLHKKVKHLNLSSVITFYGKQDNVIPFLEKTDIFVYPSICQEVFGISVVEAMAFGKICISNQVGGLPEIIINGKNGFLTEELSVEGLERAIEHAILSFQNNTCYQISKEARVTAQKFSILNTIENLNNIYMSL